MTRWVRVMYLLILTGTCSVCPGEAKVPFPVGEKLTYVIRWGMVPVGTGVLHVQGIETLRGRRVYKIVATARSNAFLSTFYEVDDRVVTYVDVEKLYPLEFRKKLSEGGYECDEKMVYDQDRHRAVFTSPTSKKEMVIPPGVQDALSCLYFFRTMDFEVGRTLFLDVNADEKNWELQVRVIREESLDIRHLGGFQTVKVEPVAKFEGIFVRKGRIFVWVTRDKLRLPVLMKSKVPFGSVSAALTKIERDIL